ncbi:MAG: DUF480 domain-containing protein [Pirellulales bacterium]
MSSIDTPSDATGTAPAWRPLTARQRRVLGTLMEKSKTTPDAYPMTFLGLTTGCNQKSNRQPVNNYSQEQIEESTEQLREMGAIAMVLGSGRVAKVRHYAYQWLGINKIEAAVMTELLLRGEQTVGELRTRASRMEPINDLATLNQVLDGLHSRNLVVYLTPQGRGQLVSHNLYQEHELEQIKKQVAEGGYTSTEESEPTPSRTSTTSSASNTNEISELKSAVQQLLKRVAYLEEQLGVTPPT